MRMVDGYYPLPTKPGLGIEVDERALARHPFGGTKPFVLLPVHEDGSIASP
jgi:galactonate dehydratase